MVIPVSIQIYYFLTTIAAGVFIGILFDIYRIIRGFSSPKGIITAISDILFWILAALLIFIFFLYTNRGSMGYYTFIGIIIGVYLYFKILSRKVIKALRMFVYYVFKLVRIIFILIFYPIKLIRYLFYYIIFEFKVIFKRGRDKALKTIKQNKKKKNKKIKEKKKEK